MTTNDTTERDLGRVEGKLDLVISMLTKSDDRHVSLAQRVTSLEKRVLAAVLMGGGGLAGYAFDAKQLFLGLIH